jgi:hypothetical protein
VSQYEVTRIYEFTPRGCIVKKYWIVRQDIVCCPNKMNAQYSADPYPGNEPDVRNPAHERETICARKTKREHPVKVNQTCPEKAPKCDL